MFCIFYKIIFYFSYLLNLNSRRDIFVLKTFIYYFVIIFMVIQKKKKKLVWSNNIFCASIYSMKAIQLNLHIIKSLSCILNILWVIDLSLILFNTSCGMYSIPKESMYTALFPSIINKTQCIPSLLRYRNLSHMFDLFLDNVFKKSLH